MEQFNDPEVGLTVFPNSTTKVKLMICVTMYNEEFKELDDTLRGIAGIIVILLYFVYIENMDNLHLAYDLTPEEVAVFVVIDGRSKVSPTLFHV